MEMQASQPQAMEGSCPGLGYLGVQCLRQIPHMLIQAVPSTGPQVLGQQQALGLFLSRVPAPEVQGCQELE